MNLEDDRIRWILRRVLSKFKDLSDTDQSFFITLTERFERRGWLHESEVEQLEQMFTKVIS